jgi:hypothetical protein
MMTGADVSKRTDRVLAAQRSTIVVEANCVGVHSLVGKRVGWHSFWILRKSVELNIEQTEPSCACRYLVSDQFEESLVTVRELDDCEDMVVQKKNFVLPCWLRARLLLDDPVHPAAKYRSGFWSGTNSRLLQSGYHKKLCWNPFSLIYPNWMAFFTDLSDPECRNADIDFNDGDSNFTHPRSQGKSEWKWICSWIIKRQSESSFVSVNDGREKSWWINVASRLSNSNESQMISNSQKCEKSN